MSPTESTFVKFVVPIVFAQIGVRKYHGKMHFFLSWIFSIRLYCLLDRKVKGPPRIKHDSE